MKIATFLFLCFASGAMITGGFLTHNAGDIVAGFCIFVAVLIQGTEKK
ncbi:MAG TPA: hypothetical protein VIH31_01220 [Candidatus Paceibacterota bacterium]